MKCPTLLLNELVKACTAADYLDIHIIQLSYENYEDPEKGRKDVSVAIVHPVDKNKNLQPNACFSFAVFISCQ